MDFWSSVWAEVVAGAIVALLLSGIAVVWRWFSKQRFKLQLTFEANPKDK